MKNIYPTPDNENLHNIDETTTISVHSSYEHLRYTKSDDGLEDDPKSDGEFEEDVDYNQDPISFGLPLSPEPLSNQEHPEGCQQAMNVEPWYPHTTCIPPAPREYQRPNPEPYYLMNDDINHTHNVQYQTFPLASTSSFGPLPQLMSTQMPGPAMSLLEPHGFQDVGNFNRTTLQHGRDRLFGRNGGLQLGFRPNLVHENTVYYSRQHHHAPGS
jgi:hypothetical protein